MTLRIVLVKRENGIATIIANDMERDAAEGVRSDYSRPVGPYFIVDGNQSSTGASG